VNGYYAHEVDESTAILPSGWQQRLVPIQNPNTANAIGWCLEVHDPAESKLVVGREKDLQFVKVLTREKMIAVQTMAQRLAELPEDCQESARQRFERILRL
jgi:hypothetical protein